MSTNRARGDDFFRLAITQKRPVIVASLAEERFLEAVHLELPVEGLPHGQRITLFAWADPPATPRRVGVDVVKVDDTVLEAPVRVALDLEVSTVVCAEEAADLWPCEPNCQDSVQWLKQPAGETREQVVRLDAEGLPVYATVDTTTHPYMMVCACGRQRYASGRVLHQVEACHVCTRQRRLRRRAVAQYISRKKRKRCSVRLQRPEG